MMRIMTPQPFDVYPDNFSKEVIDILLEKIDNPILGYKLASETEIVQELGTKHMQMGFPIVYTSADSIVQIAACEDVIPVTELYKMCETGW